MSHSILIVDDELGLAELLGELLRLRGHEVELAFDGQQGLALIAAQRFALVVTDVMMPLMSGIEMVRRMREMPEVAATPVIVMTAVPSGITAEERRLVQGILIKPFSLPALHELMDRLLAGP